MDSKDGYIVGQAAIDAVALLGERIDDPNLLSVTIVIVAEDGKGRIRTVSHVWPPKE